MVAGSEQQIARVLEWAGIPFDEGEYSPHTPAVKHITGRFFCEALFASSCVLSASLICENPLWSLSILCAVGPGKEGNCGPYVQSQRLDIYAKHAKHLSDVSSWILFSSPSFVNLRSPRRSPASV
jgi:glutamyl/glutaminyl-tRNA synthetase